MPETYRVTKRVLADHPDGYKVLVAVPGDEIPMARAVALGLVAAKPKTTKETDEAGPVKTAVDPGVHTAEVRREPPVTRRRT